jgi:hypothetical protein
METKSRHFGRVLPGCIFLTIDSTRISAVVVGRNSPDDWSGRTLTISFQSISLKIYILHLTPLAVFSNHFPPTSPGRIRIHLTWALGEGQGKWAVENCQLGRARIRVNYILAPPPPIRTRSPRKDETYRGCWRASSPTRVRD